jgi:cysteine desulfurase
MIYLDNNATTKVCDEAKEVMLGWIQSCSNPSGASVLSKASQSMIEKFKAHIMQLTNITSKTHEILITSGATESNCSIIRMCVDSWYRQASLGTQTCLPHIITSSLEHKSILECLSQLDELDHKVEVTYIHPNIYLILKIMIPLTVIFGIVVVLLWYKM